MTDDEQFTPEHGDAESFDDWDHYEPPEDEGWLDPDVGRPPVVDDLRPGETLGDRNARLIRQQELERQADRPAGMKSDPLPEPLFVYVDGKRLRLGGGRPTHELIRGSAVKVTDADGNETWRDLGRDDDAVRTFVEAHASERGFSLQELQQPRQRGRPSNADKRGQLRQKVLVEIIEGAVAAGAKTSALCKVLGLDRRRIAELRPSGKTGHFAAPT